MRYNPFRYIYCENDILKLVSCIMENTKGEDSKGGDDFWAKAEALYYQALIPDWRKMRPVLPARMCRKERPEGATKATPSGVFDRT